MRTPQAVGDGGAPGASLTQRSVSGVLWGGLGTALRTGLQVAAQVVLARILGPEQYGLFATALVVVMFSHFFSDIGISYGLIQKKEVTDDDVRFVTTWQLLLGAAVGVVLFAAAGPVATFFGDPRIAGVLRLLSVGPLLAALSGPAVSLLKRDLDYRSLNVAGVVGYAIGFLGIGVPLALAGAGVHALVAAYLATAAVSLVLLYRARPHPVRPLAWYPGARGVLGFGTVVFATNVVNWVMASIDRVIVARMFPMAAVGLYSTLGNFIVAPAQALLSTLQSVLYSAAARAQDDDQRQRGAFVTMIGVVMLGVAPVFWSVAAVADTVVLGLYGARWSGGAQVLAPLALAMPAYVAMGMATPLLWTTGNVTAEFRLQVPMAIAWAAGCALFASTGSLAVVSWAIAAMFALRAGVIVAATMRAVRVGPRQVARSMQAGIAASLLTAGAVYGADLAARAASPHPPVWLAIDIAAGAVALPLALRLVRHRIAPGAIALLASVLARLPARLRRPLARAAGIDAAAGGRR